MCRMNMILGAHDGRSLQKEDSKRAANAASITRAFPYQNQALRSGKRATKRKNIIVKKESKIQVTSLPSVEKDLSNL